METSLIDSCESTDVHARNFVKDLIALTYKNSLIQIWMMVQSLFINHIDKPEHMIV